MSSSFDAFVIKSDLRAILSLIPLLFRRQSLLLKWLPARGDSADLLSAACPDDRVGNLFARRDPLPITIVRIVRLRPNSATSPPLRESLL